MDELDEEDEEDGGNGDGDDDGKVARELDESEVDASEMTISASEMERRYPVGTEVLVVRLRSAHNLRHNRRVGIVHGFDTHTGAALVRIHARLDLPRSHSH